ncbi:hypothetical protein EDD21DRAFT_354160 [Dissophora ornata]|nr:hypothetical protein EDD21DRAFT_354160 [Dissophora ornata]
MVLKKHRWSARKVRDKEYLQIANRLFKLVGGSIGAKRPREKTLTKSCGFWKDFCEDQTVFSISSMARPLGYIVRPTYLQSKDANGNYPWMQSSSSHMVGGSIESHLVHQRYPLYLQPKDANERYLRKKHLTGQTQDCPMLKELAAARNQRHKDIPIVGAYPAYISKVLSKRRA